MAYKIESETITEETKATSVPLNEWKFQITNGNTGELVVSDPLLDTEVIATERAKSEFLKNSYAIRKIQFRTHRTDFVKNQTINVRGLPYLVKDIKTDITSTSIKTTIGAVRYD